MRLPKVFLKEHFTVLIFRIALKSLEDNLIHFFLEHVRDLNEKEQWESQGALKSVGLLRETRRLGCNI